MTQVMTDWLAPMPDKSLPHVRIRTALLGLLQELRVEDTSRLKESGIGAVSSYYSCSCSSSYFWSCSYSLSFSYSGSCSNYFSFPDAPPTPASPCRQGSNVPVPPPEGDQGQQDRGQSRHTGLEQAHL